MLVSAHINAPTQKWWYCSFTCVTPSAAAEPAHPAGAARKRPDHHGPQQAEYDATAQVSLLFSLLISIKFEGVCHDKEDLGHREATGQCICIFTLSKCHYRLLFSRLQLVPVQYCDECGRHNELLYAEYCCDNWFVWLLRSLEQLGSKLIQTSAHVVGLENHNSLIGHTSVFRCRLMHLSPPTTTADFGNSFRWVMNTDYSLMWLHSKSTLKTESSLVD